MTNISPRHAVAAMALLLETGAAPVADESGIVAGATHTLEVNGTTYSYVLLDVLLDVDGRWVIVEANGSNAAGSIAHDEDAPRVGHLLDTLDARNVGGDVVVIAYQADTPCRPEIYSRAAQLATGWQKRSGADVALVSVMTKDVPDGPVVLVATTEESAGVLEVDDEGRLRWRGRTVALLSNGNVIPALIRRGQIGSIDELDLRILHEGPLVGPLVHDKGAQQDLAQGTGFRALAWNSATSESEAIAMIQRMSERHSIMVKINAGSGGTGVFPVAKGALLSEIRAALSAALGKTAAKYGSTMTAFPVRAFEFATAWPIAYGGLGKHLWDLRLEILSRPGSVEVTPLSARACPEPYDGTLKPTAVIGNLTGTHDGADRVIPADALFGFLGLSSNQVAALVESAASWMVNAQRGSAATVRAVETGVVGESGSGSLSAPGDAYPFSGA